jgi:hypothetical protein
MNFSQLQIFVSNEFSKFIVFLNKQFVTKTHDMFFSDFIRSIQILFKNNSLDIDLLNSSNYIIYINPELESKTFVLNVFIPGENELRLEESNPQIFDIISNLISSSKNRGCKFLDEDFTIIISCFDLIEVKIRRDNDSFFNHLVEEDRELLFSPDPLRFNFEPYEFIVEKIDK